ncbi:S8 family peptidase [Demequina litorisediminis]|uniref:Peptidase S8/S53 domain-containing protein n=1 Tax=Demequina litorisediminis TaxID=1849022 RepID=A0ABQ6IEE3_9MICO|nr:S8/S53 family peptidase [Demequina litorisediminis]GMA36205.1 hypothetical protein GCM10025876_24090 [Demequina litorisediminis]
MKPIWRVCGTLAATGVVAWAGSVPAVADIADEGLWYYDLANIGAIHDSGITGEGVTIAVIDSPINLEVPTLAGADIQPQTSPCLLDDGEPRIASTSTDYDVAQHGTQIVSLLVGTGEGYDGQQGVKGIAPDATVLTYPFDFDNPPDDIADECPGSEARNPDDTNGHEGAASLSIEAAIDAGADIISMSMGISSSLGLNNAVARAVREGVILVAAVPNSDFGVQFGGASPSDMNGVVSVTLGDRDGTAPHHDEFLDVVAPGVDILHQGIDGDWEQHGLADGTSEATPFVSATLALAMQAFPSATPNQAPTGTHPQHRLRGPRPRV